MKKKVAIILAGVMLMGCLTGCSESVTAEDLIDGAIDTDYLAYQTETAVEMSMEESGFSMDMLIETNLSYEVSHDSAHIEGEMEVCVSAAGVDYTETETAEANLYYTLDDNTEIQYAYDFDYEEWYVEEGYTNKESYVPELSSDMFEDLELEESKKGYEVKGIIDDEKAIFETKNVMIDEIIKQVEDCEIEATLIFNDDYELETYKLKVDVDKNHIYNTEQLGEVSISSFEIVITIDDVDDGVVKVPAKVEQNAISPDEAYDTEEETETEDETESDPEGITLGTITDTTYENAYLNIGWVVPSSDWTMFTREEIDSVYNTTIDIMGEDYGEALANAAVFYDMMAMNESTYDNINVVAENIAQYQGAYTEEDYANVCLTTVKALYEEMGYTDITMSLSTIEFMGETHPCTISEYTVSGMVQYQLQSYVIVNDHMVVITATSNESIDACSAMYESFYRLGM